MSQTAPSEHDLTLQQALARHRAGGLAAAEDAYRGVLEADPRHAAANHHLGVLLVQTGRMEEGVGRLRLALGSDPREPLYYFSLAKGLLASGNPGEAAAVLHQAGQVGLGDKRFDPLKSEIRDTMVQMCRRSLTAHPNDSVLLDRLGGALLMQGKTEEAVSCFRRALAADPEFADAHFHLGTVLSQTGRIAEGFEHYTRRAVLTYGAGDAPKPEHPEPEHKLRHDAAQRDYIWGKRDAPPPPDMFHLADGSRIEGPAVDPAHATAELLESWRRSRPQMVVIDNFLTRPALEKLREFCAASTVWRKIYTAGYLGGAPEDGFSCPLLAQIIEEIQASFAPILEGEQFRYLGAFKYDSELSTGTNTHADNSRINVNFYIAPDEANLDPRSGGMEIWDMAAPDMKTMRQLNGSEEMVRDLLKRSGAKRTVIPHRSNRAVIFKSTHFHKTDKFTFKSDYLSRRINISILFGQFGPED